MARRALCACPGCYAIPERAGSAGVGVLGAFLGGGYPEGRGEALSGFVRAHLCCCHTAMGNLGGEQGLEMENRDPNGAGEAVKNSSTCPE